MATESSIRTRNRHITRIVAERMKSGTNSQVIVKLGTRLILFRSREAMWHSLGAAPGHNKIFWCEFSLFGWVTWTAKWVVHSVWSSCCIALCLFYCPLYCQIVKFFNGYWLQDLGSHTAAWLWNHKSAKLNIQVEQRLFEFWQSSHTVLSEKMRVEQNACWLLCNVVGEYSEKSSCKQ